MLTEHRRLQLKTNDGKVELEVNWSDNEKVTGCKMIKFIDNEKEFVIKRDDLVAALMVFSDSDTMKKLLPLKRTKVHQVQRMLGFEFAATKDYKKGEKINVRAPWIDTIVDEDEVLSGDYSKRKSKYLKDGKLR